MLTAAKSSLAILIKSCRQKQRWKNIWKGNVFKNLSNNTHWKISWTVSYSKAIYKSIIDLDDTSNRKSFQLLFSAKPTLFENIFIKIVTMLFLGPYRDESVKQYYNQLSAGGDRNKHPLTRTLRNPHNTISCHRYSLSDSSLAITFATFFWPNVQVFNPNLANMLGALLRVCINIFSCLNSAKCWFCSLGPFVKCVHCRHYDLACLYCSQQTDTRDCSVGNVHILQ